MPARPLPAGAIEALRKTEVLAYVQTHLKPIYQG
jgi:hypothetical protein